MVRLAPRLCPGHLNGNQVRLSDYQGKVVVLNFWATWCGPCVREMPMFQEFQDRYPDFVMLGIDEEEGSDLVRDFLKIRGSLTPILWIRTPIGRDLQGQLSADYLFHR